MYDERPNDPLFVDAVKTPLTDAQAAYYLKLAFKEVTGDEPSLDSLAIIWAQTTLETGHFRSCYNGNVGNIKKLPNQKYTSFKCSEIINGKEEFFVPYHPQTFFAAWDDPLGGMVAYIQFLKRPRYKDAYAQLVAGNAIKYSAALKVAGYFTADLIGYTKGVVSLSEQFKNHSAEYLSWAPPESPKPIDPPTPIPELIPSPPVVETPPSAPSPTPTSSNNFFLDLIQGILKFFSGSK